MSDESWREQTYHTDTTHYDFSDEQFARDARIRNFLRWLWCAVCACLAWAVILQIAWHLDGWTRPEIAWLHSAVYWLLTAITGMLLIAFFLGRKLRNER
jgi:hypothetical protein